MSEECGATGEKASGAEAPCDGELRVIHERT